MNIKCPYCNEEQKQEPSKTWKFGRLIEKRSKDRTEWGASINCSQYYCVCGKAFRLYLTTKGKYWTIPKSNEPAK